MWLEENRLKRLSVQIYGSCERIVSSIYSQRSGPSCRDNSPQATLLGDLALGIIWTCKPFFHNDVAIQGDKQSKHGLQMTVMLNLESVSK